jgi:hypothetical protein
MPPPPVIARGRTLLAVLMLAACAGVDAPAASPTPAVAVLVSTPYAAYAAASPPARLSDQPGGTPGPLLPRGTDLRVEAFATAADGQVWYRVTTAGGQSGWLPAAALSLVGDQPAVTPATATPRPATATQRPAVTPAPRPLVVTGSGSGLFLRVQPGTGAIIRAYPDGAVVTPLGESAQLEGRRWLRVRAADGQEGWMAAEYLRPAP